ncbi:methenyltetrahydromethanopterin cyclohydrolase [Methanocella conradii HZ254]|uniref:Methenyltetrahydromethanopterin cyclohydrolase n=1 Tax=Methanocella conradii (strain DSM 24694 / JCM 17849 / CGMCC 1.5162 / HZ254) TaxID=1041930 RepID=H8I6Y9_METCZ|nr:methenyltetrahydromethanopterin cyclohydrolase [Methanocella conradii]AFC99819.1 methenyltetrahydromethanopterin cyclohydrolase [Methanocella conradii HZ254]
MVIILANNYRDISINDISYDIVGDMIDYPDDYKVEVHTLGNDSIVVDCGVKAKGGYEAGLAFTQICMGGLSSPSITHKKLKHEIFYPFIEVYTDYPTLACLAAQKAGWRISQEGYFAMGSGPARALALKPKHTYEVIEYEDDSDFAVIALEASALPSEKVMDYIASECGVETSNVVAIVAPTNSLVGSIQIAGRVVEVAVYKLNEMGFDTRHIISAFGSAPIPPVKKDPAVAMGTTNDASIYHGSVTLTVDGGNIKDFVAKVPSSSSKDYGRPFYTVFKEAKFDFYKLDPSIFAPAEIIVNDVSVGETYVAGGINADVTMESFGFKKV